MKGCAPTLDSSASRLSPVETDCVRLSLKDDGRVELSARTPTGQWVRYQSANPEAEARGLVDRALAGRELPPVVAVIGSGLGHVVDELRRRRSDVRVVGLEVVPELIDLWRRRSSDVDALVASGQLAIAVAPAFELPRAGWPASVLQEEPLVIVSPVVAHHWPEAVDGARRAFEQFWFERRANEEARQRLAPVYLRNILRNLPVLANASDMSVLDGLAQGEGLVLCGAGPSLEALLPALKANRDRAWYVALDTSVRPLLAAGIVPDLVVCIDPTPLNGRHLVNLPTRHRPWLVADLSVEPRALTAFDGRLFACRVNQADPWEWLGTLGPVPTTVKAWGSVLTAACDLITRMNPARVAFAGVDLAYTKHQTYCRGVTFESDWEEHRRVHGLDSIEAVWRDQLKDFNVYEPDVAGTPTLTAGHMIAFRNWVRSLAESWRGCTFTNVSAAGILHGEGIEQCDLTEWAARQTPPSVRPEERLQAVAKPRWRESVPAWLDAASAAGTSQDEPWAAWRSRVPALERAEIERILEISARKLRALNGHTEMNATQTDWIDVPYDAALFSAREPMEWTVGESNVGTFAYRLDGKTLLLSFKINNSSIAGYPSNALYIHLPEGYVAARGAANAIWIGSPSGKEMGYATIHPGENILILHRATEERFPIDKDYFFTFGQITIEIQ